MNATLSISTPVRITEGGDGGTRSAQFTVELSEPSTEIVTVNFATADGTAKASKGDYFATPGTLTFAPGETTKTIYVGIVGDSDVERDETYRVKLSDAIGAVIGVDTAEGSIINDDFHGHCKGRNC